MTKIEVGQSIKGYRIERKLGEGGMGSVWLVTHEFLKRQQALKVISEKYSSHPLSVARFTREAQIMASVSHPNAVQVYDAWVEQGHACILMEYVPGRSLDKVFLPPRAMTLDVVGVLIDQLCGALHAIHERGIVHRDLKPANLILVESESGVTHLKLLDFGLAKLLQGDHDEAISHPDQVLGTFAYMSPEQADGRPVDARSDIYSTGVILYELLTGRRPFVGNRAALRNDHLHAKPPPFGGLALNGTVPFEIEQLVLQCLEKIPDRRPRSAEALAQAFREAMARPVRANSFKRSRTPRPRLSRVAGALLLATPLALGTIILTRNWLNGSSWERPLAVTPNALKSVLDLWVWPDGESTRPGRRLGDPGLLPLKPGDLIRIEARVDRPSYLYLVWVDARGEVTPLWPWVNGDWDAPTNRDQPMTRLDLPQEVHRAIPLKADDPGVQILLLVARESPLEDRRVIKGWFQDWPRQSGLDPIRMGSAVWFEDGEPPPGEPERSPINWDETRRIDDPTWRIRALSRERSSDRSTTTRAVCFSFRGG